MTERPILFSAPMVRALLAGTKTQTRRVIVSPKKAAPYFVVYADKDGSNPRPVYSADGERGHYIDAQGYDVEERMQCPYGHTGDQMWVRETWAPWAPHPDNNDTHAVVYRADNGPEKVERWKPAIHMFRWASRILLEVTGVRVERLQDISEEDAQAEGCEKACEETANDERLKIECGYFPPSSYEHGYRLLWESINGPGSWEANPWVWVVEFKRLTPAAEKSAGNDGAERQRQSVAK